MDYLTRKPTKQEIKLLEILVNKSSVAIHNNWNDGLLVRFMDDGEMGSLYLLPSERLTEERFFGAQVSEHQFLDMDGVEVIASLNLDNKGNLFELDIWKTDFGRLIKLPDL